jgi:hypothetical protein
VTASRPSGMTVKSTHIRAGCGMLALVRWF